jgi:hypothetical protein
MVNPTKKVSRPQALLGFISCCLFMIVSSSSAYVIAAMFDTKCDNMLTHWILLLEKVNKTFNCFHIYFRFLIHE